MEFNGLDAAASHSSHIWLVAEIVRDASLLTLDTTFNIRISTVIYLLSVRYNTSENCMYCNNRHNIMCAVLNPLKFAYLAT